MDFWKSAAGVIEVELTSAEPEQALDAINQQRIPVFHVAFSDSLTVRFRVSESDFQKLAALVRNRGEALHLLGRTGAYQLLRQLSTRKVPVLGIALLLLLVLFLPTRVLFIRVEGNVHVPTQKIISAAEACGIRFWTSRREVRSEKMKNALLSAVPELQWAGVNTRGCVAWISVRERTLREETETTGGVANIVAGIDGIVDFCTATRGNIVCTPGQAVRAGEVLISGYTDCGSYLQATQAEGEIYATTQRKLEVVSPLQAVSVRNTGTINYQVSLILGKKRINLWKDSGISDTTCGRIYSEYYVTLPGGFRLPVALAVEAFPRWEKQDLQQTADASAMSAFARKHLLEQMIAGQIRSNRLSYSEDAELARLTGSCICYEMIGRVQCEQIGE